jgi:hypothetical protein
MQVLSVVEVEEVSGGLSLGQAILGGLVSAGMNAGFAALGRFIASGGPPDYSRATSHGDMY